MSSPSRISHSGLQGFPGNGPHRSTWNTHAWAGSSSMRTEIHAIKNYIYPLPMHVGRLVARTSSSRRCSRRTRRCVRSLPEPWWWLSARFCHVGAENHSPRRKRNARTPSAGESAAGTPGMRPHTSSVRVEQKYAPRHHLAAGEPMRHKCGCSRPRTKSDVSTFKIDCVRRTRQSQCRP